MEAGDIRSYYDLMFCVLLYQNDNLGPDPTIETK